MANLEVRDQVHATVRAALLAGKPIAKADLVRQFGPRGIARTTIHRWADEAVVAAAGERLIAETELGKKTAALVATAAPPAPTAASGIPVMERLQGCLDVFDALLRISKREDGSIKNVGLAGNAAREIRKTIQTLANVQGILQNRQMDEQKQFVEDVIAIIKMEAPDVRERIVARLRALNQRYGV
jgi:hypothetical protein